MGDSLSMADTEKNSLRYCAPTNEMLALEIRHLRELNTVKEQALKLQAAEYERRLNALNHEAEQLKSMQAKYWPREVAEASDS